MTMTTSWKRPARLQIHWIQKSGKNSVMILPGNYSKWFTLNWQHIEPIYMPPYSPDLNPIERLWHHLKSHSLAGLITKAGE